MFERRAEGNLLPQQMSREIKKNVSASQNRIAWAMLLPFEVPLLFGAMQCVFWEGGGRFICITAGCVGERV